MTKASVQVCKSIFCCNMDLCKSIFDTKQIEIILIYYTSQILAVIWSKQEVHLASTAFMSNLKKQVSMTRRCLNNHQQTNPWHQKEET